MAAIWYGWKDGRILLTFDQTRKRLEFIRRNPAVSVCVLDRADWFRNVVLFGRVVEIFDDENLANVDELSHSYMNRPYPDRTRPRVCAWMEIDSWFAWNAYAEVSNLEEGGTTIGTASCELAAATGPDAGRAERRAARALRVDRRQLSQELHGHDR